MTRFALFRLDASREIGGGHAARCVVLAEALERLGWRCAFAGTPETREVWPAMRRWRFLPLDRGLCDGGPAEAAALADAAGACDLLVVDHYGLGKGFETAARGFARTILAMEDLAGRTHHCDLLLDPALDRSPDSFEGRVPGGCRLLLGPAYALLRGEFAAARATAVRRSGGLERVLVSVGATDAGNATATVLAGLERSALADGTPVDVALTAAAPHLATVRRLADRSRLRVTVHVDPPSMAALMASADLAVGAGGSGSWERCCLGLPSILLTLADNQRPNVDSLARRGAAVGIGAPDTDAIAGAVDALAGDPDRRRRMVEAALAICDGRGGARVAALIHPPRARDGRIISLRPATAEDSARLLAWRQDSSALAFFRNPLPPTPEEHARWLQGKLSDPACLLNIIQHGGTAAGSLRLDAIGGGRAYEVSITIAAGSRRLGLGRAALALARQLVPEAEIVAYVMKANTASRALFADAGFAPAGEPDWYAVPPLAPPVPIRDPIAESAR